MDLCFIGPRGRGPAGDGSWAGSKLTCDTRKPWEASDAPDPRARAGARRSQAGWQSACEPGTQANLIYKHDFIHLASFSILYFYSFWYLLKFFFKIPPCLSCFKGKMEHGAVGGGPNTAELWMDTLGSNPGLPLSSCVICSELLSLSETQRPHSPITIPAF